MKVVICERCKKKFIISDEDYIIGKKYLCYDCRGGKSLRQIDRANYKNKRLDDFWDLR